MVGVDNNADKCDDCDKHIDFDKDKPVKLTTRDLTIDYAGKYMSGLFVVLVGQPLDTIKVRMQTFPTMYHGMMDCMRKTMKRDSLKTGLYAGTSPALVGGLLDNTILLLGHGMSQSLIQTFVGAKSEDDLSPLGQASAGCLTACISAFYTCPMELIKCQLQVLNEFRSRKLHAGLVIDIGPLQLIKYIVYQHTYRGLFYGLGLTIAREMAGSLIYFGGYEICANSLSYSGEKREQMGAFRTMVAASMAGMLLWIFIFPLDVIKSRIQILTTEKSLIEVCREIIRKDGYLAFYNGLKPTMIKTIAVTPVLYITYEYTKRGLTNFIL